MKKIKKFVAFMLIFVMAFSLTQSLAAEDSYTIYFDGTLDYTKAYEVLDMVNAARAEEGIDPLVMDRYLLDSAMQRAAENAIFFDHARPDGTQWYTAIPAKFDYSYRGENIAAKQSTAEKAMNTWMNSSGHKNNITRADFKSVGIGCFYQGTTVYWVQLFSSDAATPPASKPVNTSTTAEVKISDENAHFGFDLVPADGGRQAVIYNYNYESGRDPIRLNNKNITFSTTPESISQITSGGLLPDPAREGYIGFKSYLGGSLIFDELVTLANHTFKVGDSDRDGNLSNSDLILIARTVVGIDADLDLIAADMNYDNAITNTDIILLARKLVGLD